MAGESERSRAPRVVLVGPPGAGKTAVGHVLAQRWQVPLCDTDAAVEVCAGKPIADIFVDEGEPTFRALERDAVAVALNRCDGVVSLGGGAVMAAETREALEGHRVAFLDVGLAAASSRVGLGSARPLLLGNVRGQLKALLDARRPYYLQVAEFTVLTDSLGVDEVADEVERLLDE
jgi:shikimate kinase